MLYDLDNPLQAENFKRRCNQLYKKRCIVELTERKPRRSDSQNRYLHAALGYFGLQYGYRAEQVKQWYFKELCNPDIFVREITDKVTGEKRMSLRSSAELTTEEMTTAIERFRNWASAEAGIYIPSPEEHRMVEMMEIEVQRGKMFL